jgi:restriction endonuclease S subunit
MASDWQRVRTADVAAHMAAGPFGSAIGMKHFCESGVPIIRGSNLSNEVGRRLSDEGLVFLREEKAAEFTRSEAKRGDLVFTCWGTIDQVGLIDERSRYESYIVSNKQMLLSPDRKRVESLFLYYLFSSPQSRSEILNQGIGSSVPGFNLGQLKAFEFLLPPLPEQKRIARILGTLDDKIELNRRMNATLEDISRAIFKSWFVDFDPVRQKAAGKQPVGMDAKTAALFPDSFEDSEIGEVPKGWRVQPVESLCEFLTSGGTPARKNADFWGGGTISWFKTGELLDGPLLESEEKITHSGLEKSSCKLWPENTVLFALYASPTVGRLGVLTEPATANQAAAALKSKSEYGTAFLVNALLEARGILQRIAVGAAQQNINQGILKAHPTVTPPTALAAAFSARGDQLFSQRVALARSSRTLATLRDTLLPKLLSGEVRVPEAEQTVEEATA